MRTLFISIVVITGLSSCYSNRYIYSASPANNPYFTEKGESKVAAYYSETSNNTITDEYANGWDFHGAYALTDHWAITAGYFNRREKDKYSMMKNDPFDSSIVNYKRNLLDVGGGYFLPLNKRKTITFNLFGGVSFGKFSMEDDGFDKNSLTYHRFHTSNVTKWFWQPSINFTPGDYVRFSFSLKSSYVYYRKIETSYTAEELQYFILTDLAKGSFNFFEPSWDFQFGLPQYPWVKIDMIMSFVSRPIEARWNVRQFNSSIGLCFDLTKLKKIQTK